MGKHPRGSEPQGATPTPTTPLPPPTPHPAKDLKPHLPLEQEWPLRFSCWHLEEAGVKDMQSLTLKIALFPGFLWVQPRVQKQGGKKASGPGLEPRSM